MTSNASRVSLEKPLLGAVLCCTSISPEERTRLADYAQQMGAEHKLDLTSDVTHLIVGTTNTPKYAYVAREREDVKVLTPRWVEAVREAWMEDRKLNMNELDAEHRMPTLAGLKICITGFDDLEFRAKLAKNVERNGGEYTGDLTKEVTHLIAAVPQGKKYEYATAWQKKIVSLKWYQDTLERGMQLEESSYHPTVPVEEQGVGAWNRKAKSQSMLGKRTSTEGVSEEPTRKLRRTASAKFGSQSGSMWGDIVGSGDSLQHGSRSRDMLRPSKSMPLGQQQDNQDLHQDMEHKSRPRTAGYERERYLLDTAFAVEGFDNKKRQVLTRALEGAGAKVHDSITDMMNSVATDSTKPFVIVPYQTKSSALPSLGDTTIVPIVVTELWLERCMLQKVLIPSSTYPMGNIIEAILDPGIENLVINATGFESIETLHISKAVRLVGAKYEEIFTANASVLICCSRNINHKKLQHAKEWRVPAVSEKWLSIFLKGGSIPAFGPYLLQSMDEDEADQNDLGQQLEQKRRMQTSRESKQPQQFADLGDGFAAASKVRTTEEVRPTRDSGHVSNAKGETTSRTTKSSHHPMQSSPQNGSRKPTSEETGAQKRQSLAMPLQEITPNSPSRRTIQQASKRRLINIHDDATNLSRVESAEQTSAIVDENDINTISRSPALIANDANSMNSAIQDLLDMKARAKVIAEAAKQDDTSRGKKKRLLGRAFSNLSNSSRTSNRRQSRASSIDSLNTDGVGSEVVMPSANSRPTQDEASHSTRTRPGSFSLKGRAQPKPSSASTSAQQPAPPLIDISDPNLCREEYADPEPYLQLTQLGYEDSEEAIALREKLAEKRRARIRSGQKEGDPAPEEPRVRSHDEIQKKGKREGKKVVKDDEAMLAFEDQLGWGGGRRTRQSDRRKNKSLDNNNNEDIMF